MLEFSIIIVLVIVLFAIFLFIKEIFPTDVTALIIMSLLMLSGLVTAQEGISGFGNEAVLTILAMFVLSSGIEKTGLLHSLSIKIFGLTGSNQFLQLVLIMLVVAVFSSIMNNAAIVAVLIPFVLNLTKMSKTSPSKLLIPLSYISMAAGTMTLIGTSTNLLTNTIIVRSGLTPFGIFDFWKIGFCVMAITFVYFLTIGNWLLPKKSEKSPENGNDNFLFTFELKITKNSKLVEKKIKDTLLRKKYNLKIITLHREKNIWRENFSNRTLRAGDILTIESDKNTIRSLEDEIGVKVIIEDLHKDHSKNEILSMIIPQGSFYIGKKIEDLNLKKKYGAFVIAVRKGTRKITERIDKVKLHLGDLLLLKTNKDNAEKIQGDPNLILIEKIENNYKKDKKLIAVLIFLGVILFAALGIYPILTTAFVGLILMILTSVLTTKEAYSSIRWEVIFLLAGLIPLGIAIEKSGVAALIGDFLGKAAANHSHYFVMVVFFIFTTLLTEILSNNASAILLVPIGLELAKKISLDPYMMTLLIMISASTSFLTPIGYQTNTMIYGTGVYKFSDFLRVGLILNIILAFATPFIILKLWTGI